MNTSRVAYPGFPTGAATLGDANLLLPLATKLGQGNIFRSMCQEFCPQGGMHGRERVCHACPPPGRYYEIWSMSRWYVSYWNAFLFGIFFAKNCKKMKTNALQSGSLALPTLRVPAKTALIENYF